jgi:two-component system response regulator DegU
MDIIRILLVDDHGVVRDGLGRMLELEEDMKVVGEASNAEEALAMVELISPSVILMDIKMPGIDGIELTRQIKEKLPSCNIIMFTLHGDYLPQAIKAGASGYLLKDIRRAELSQAIRKVCQGQVVISEGIGPMSS